MPGRCRIVLLGGLQVEQHGRLISRFQTQQTGALLAYLAFYRNQAHPRDLLAEILWPDDHPDVARRKLRVALHSLRRQFEPHGVPAGSVFVALRHSIRLDAGACTTDVSEFETSLEAAARAGSSLERIRLFEQAVELYSGELLPGYYEEWIMPERVRFTDMHVQALRQLVAQLEQIGDLTRALPWARRAVDADPLHEESHHDLMQLLVAVGQPEAAVRAYDRLEQLLHVEYGRAPSSISRKLAGITSGSPPSVAAPVHGIPETSGSGRLDPSFGQQRPPFPEAGISTPAALPAGTVTLLLAEMAGEANLPSHARLQVSLDTHWELLGQIFQRHGGHIVRSGADALLGAFPRAADALAGAVAAQEAAKRHLAAIGDDSKPLSETDHRSVLSDSSLRVRIGLHTGDMECREGQYHGPGLQHVRWVATAAHGGQILLSEATAAVLRPNLDQEPRLDDLGLFRLYPGAAPERLFEVRCRGKEERPFPPPNAPRAHPGYLPAPLTRFFGREAEIASLRAWVLPGETRLVTLTGPGGVGKTRLALAAATGLQEPFGGAVWFVPLMDLSDSRLILDRMMDVLRLSRAPGAEPLERVVETLAQQPALLVIDNFEHLVEEGAAVVQTLLERVPHLTCVVTSRRRLDLSGEQEHPVSSLAVPEAVNSGSAGGSAVGAVASSSLPPLIDYASVQLFLNRAQAVRPDFHLTGRNAASVAELCRRLEGIPLALELAAARMQVLTPSQALAQLHSRFELLVSRRRDLPSRHRTLRAAFDWSYQLLPPDLQRFFAQLSVFRGGWTAAAAAAVTGAAGALAFLEELQACSLVHTRSDNDPAGSEFSEADGSAARSSHIAHPAHPSPGGVLRFEMLETLREYAAEQLWPEERAALARRHAEYYLSLAEEAEPHLTGPDQAEWLERLQAEHGNLRAALAWSAACHEAEPGLRLGSALSKFWQVRAYLEEGRQWLMQFLTLKRSTGPLDLRAKTLRAAGVLARDQGDTATARRLLGESLEIWRKVGNQAGIAATLYELAYSIELQRPDEALQLAEDLPQAQALLEESLALSRGLGDLSGVAQSLDRLGNIALVTKDYENARSICAESLKIRRMLGDKRGMASSFNSLGLVAQAQLDYTAAEQYLAESLALYRAIGDQRGINIAVHNLGTVASRQGNYAKASALEEQALALSRELGHRHWEASNLGVLGFLALRQGDLSRARVFLQESLEVLRDDPQRSHRADCFRALARVSVGQGQWERAARLFAQSASLQQAAGLILSSTDQAALDQDVAATRAALGDHGFAAAWATGQRMTIEAATDYALES